ncbi:cupin domain-containing protein [Streptomyces caniscabiei]|uniref:Cupin domain-containing protein n=1 Tax=Streptomyces caniscabiei TaxID=2746961 RepID=A0ABU4N6N7_9ACTN|nr:cupin domain-containing protein [Streptomyces caniscabiei]MDX2948403.1 cupin domain-containing protein [Streptomyces caniscabiei]MDX2957691.1 cupin domain-containing protein [Streptomyces caniscabiei]MDX2989064.1 cupin domain-containing protein [Streptomyces caniscabiei]MDX3015701.1 cupin domain-containing protein [Streptomyces caniscabiei]MDX3044180.1 cupin domain-containing protein [Streptomyces caniscabiei]
MTALPDFPGAVGLSQLEVYPWPTADDEHGGSPHMHLVCSECYVVVSGHGRLETLNHKGHTTTELHPGDTVWFTPGTIHRAINDEDLRVIVVMQNSGLPEAGDAVMTFPPAHLSPEAYPDAASLLDADGTPDPERAQARRDLAIEGFRELKHQWRRGNRSAYEDFCAAAVRLVQPRLDAWEKTVDDGALAAAQAALRQIDSLRNGDFNHLYKATVSRIAQPPRQTLGMCGLLRAYNPARRVGTSAEPQ